MITLGSTIADTVTGFTGMAESYTIHRNGCIRVSIQAKVDKDGKIPDVCWFDIEDVKLIGKAVKTKPLLQVPEIEEVGGPGRSIPPSFR